MTWEQNLGVPLRVLLVALGLAVVTAAQPVQAEQSLTAEACAQLQERSARLACYDQVFGPAAPDKEALSVKAPAPVKAPASGKEVVPINAAAADSSKELSMEDLTLVAPTSAPATSAPSNTSASANTGSGGLLNRRDKVNFTSTVKALRARDKQRMVFLLENGEVWMQSSPRNLAIREGSDVTVKSGLFGGYMLRTSNGISTRVTRIK